MSIVDAIIVISIILIVIFGWDGFVSIVEELIDKTFEIIDTGIEKTNGESQT